MDKFLASVLTALSIYCASTFASDYPTVTRVDYVIGCMITNGFTQLGMQRCSCSIDFIASQMSFEDYEKAETVANIRQSPYGGDKMSLFKSSDVTNDYMEKYRRVQAEATLKCF